MLLLFCASSPTTLFLVYFLDSRLLGEAPRSLPPSPDLTVYVHAMTSMARVQATCTLGLLDGVCTAPFHSICSSKGSSLTRFYNTSRSAPEDRTHAPSHPSSRALAPNQVTHFRGCRPKEGMRIAI
ncbi:hypothetical protein FA13DRAFT_1733823 [Coprinellus micaceus]|uniref:Secreted protein n=1 Tax=Coprinellus micaceus TaxID=71717 RepID=A0A4Y7T8N3_COPMI|nr:hypothetical protein FA13DRAFT_1733823 [Coprinellus micaceus]